MPAVVEVIALVPPLAELPPLVDASPVVDAAVEPPEPAVVPTVVAAVAPVTPELAVLAGDPVVAPPTTLLPSVPVTSATVPPGFDEASPEQPSPPPTQNAMTGTATERRNGERSRLMGTMTGF